MLTTLCYIEKDEKYLMLQRTKKKDDINAGKWLGVGGKLENGETPELCLLREIKEETGLIAKNYNFRGIVIFNFNNDEPLYMYLYTCNSFKGEVQDCDEGELRWVAKKEVFNLNLWEGDRIFLNLIKDECPFFYLTLDYENDNLLSHKLEFRESYTSFEVFVPETYVVDILEALREYSLLNEGFYADAYATIDVVGHWTTLEGAKPFNGEIGKESTAQEKLMKFRVKSEFKELAYYLIVDCNIKCDIF